MEEVYQKGLECMNNGDFGSALKLLSATAERGHADSQYTLGVYYSAIENLPDTAKGWYEKAAAQGHNDAKLVLANI